MRLSTAVVRFATIAGLVTLAACRAERTPTGWSRVTAAEFSQELAAARPAGAAPLTIVDVREPELFAKGHIPGAINIPYPDAKTRAPAELDPTHDIVFVCHGGPMGDELAEIVVAKGFTKVRNLAGGMNGWSGPTVPGS